VAGSRDPRPFHWPMQAASLLVSCVGLVWGLGLKAPLLKKQMHLSGGDWNMQSPDRSFPFPVHVRSLMLGVRKCEELELAVISAALTAAVRGRG
jgi:hypothetical protein